MTEPSYTVLPLSRRAMLSQAAVGFGSLALASLLADESRADESTAKPQAIQSHVNPLAPKPPHFLPRAKRVIFLFMKGGPSHVDTFDPKPLLDSRRRQAVALRQAPRAIRRDRQSARLAVEVRAARPKRPMGQRAFPASGPPCGRPVHDPLGPWHQPGARRGAAQAAHRQRQFRPPQHRLVGQLRPGHRKRQPAGVRHDLPHAGPRRHQQLELRLPAGRVSGHAAGQRQRPLRSGPRQIHCQQPPVSPKSSGCSSIDWPR